MEAWNVKILCVRVCIMYMFSTIKFAHIFSEVRKEQLVG